MIIEKFFPTLVYGKDIQLNNNQLAQDIVNWSNKDKGVNKTNYKGWHSTTDMHIKPEYSQLVTELISMQKDIYDNEHIDRHARLGNMWANINPSGGMNMPHIHPNALFSGVYYVKSNPKSGRLKIYDPRPGANFIMPTRKPGNLGRDLWREANIEPIEGRIIMFPAWLWHSVEENMSDDIRISVSFNFIQEGFNG
tara:strand:- start:79 stop:663 length:585 start_codon:yes stop_codon:yes gene_type:complete